MKQRSPKFDIFLSTILLIGLAVLVYTAVYGPLPFTQQLRNLKAAEKHVPALQALLDQAPRFNKLKAGIWTGNNGCLSIHGVITSKSDLADLKQIVTSSKPPVGVLYHIDLPDGDGLADWQPIE